MTARRNNFDGGTTGATITTSNSALGGDAFTVGNAPVGTTVCYGNAGALGLVRPTAEYVMQHQVGGTANAAYMGWNNLGTPTQMWARFYVYLTDTSVHSGNSDQCLFTFDNSAQTGAVAVMLRNTASPAVFYLYEINGNTQTLTTTTATAGVWHRVEVRVQVGAGTTGSADLRIYTDSAVDSDTYTETVGQTGKNYALTTLNEGLLGSYVFNGTTQQINTPTVYFSNLEINDSGYPGAAPFRVGKGAPTGNLSSPIAVHTAVA